MTKIRMGSNATLIAVASIPPRIWEQDKDTWKAWATSLNVSFHTKEVYKRTICTFYDACNKPIRDVTDDDVHRYETALREDGRSESTIKRHLSPIKAYWTFARKQAEVTRHE